MSSWLRLRGLGVVCGGAAGFRAAEPAAATCSGRRRDSWPRGARSRGPGRRAATGGLRSGRAARSRPARSRANRSSTSSRRRAARSIPARRRRASMDQRNETFVPHVLAITTGTVVDFPNSDRFYHNVFSLSKAGALRSRPLRGGTIQVGPVRSAGHRARVLRHSLAHERVHPGVQPPVLRDDRRRRPLPDRQRPAGHLQRRRVERGDGIGSQSR